MAYPAALIAHLFVKKGIEEGNPVTQMKLQKIVYFAHGLHLALHNEPLIKENFQAWKFGPVIPDIYHTYKLYGSAPITDTDWEPEIECVAVDGHAKEAIDYTWETLKKINAIQLSNWTHKEGSPWQKAYVPGITDITISNNEIEEYFQRFLVK